MSTESYIVRVYRREEDNPQGLVGLVELVETQEKKSFRNLDELLEIFNSRTRGFVSQRQRSKNDIDAKGKIKP